MSQHTPQTSTEKLAIAAMERDEYLAALAVLDEIVPEVDDLSPGEKERYMQFRKKHLDKLCYLRKKEKVQKKMERVAERERERKEEAIAAMERDEYLAALAVLDETVPGVNELSQEEKKKYNQLRKKHLDKLCYLRKKEKLQKKKERVAERERERKEEALQQKEQVQEAAARVRANSVAEAPLVSDSDSSDDDMGREQPPGRPSRSTRSTRSTRTSLVTVERPGRTLRRTAKKATGSKSGPDVLPSALASLIESSCSYDQASRSRKRTRSAMNAEHADAADPESTRKREQAATLERGPLSRWLKKYYYKMMSGADKAARSAARRGPADVIEFVEVSDSQQQSPIWAPSVHIIYDKWGKEVRRHVFESPDLAWKNAKDKGFGLTRNKYVKDHFYQADFSKNPYVVEHKGKDLDLVFWLHGPDGSVTSTTVKVRQVKDDRVLGAFGALINKVGTANIPFNARGGSMLVLGERYVEPRKGVRLYANTLKAKGELEELGKVYHEWMSQAQNGVVEDLHAIHASLFEKGSKKLSKGACVGNTVVISKNLFNEAHRDAGDDTRSSVVFLEDCPGQAKNWCLCFPNGTNGKCRGVQIKLKHGMYVSFEGHMIRHCTTMTEPGPGNNVWGVLHGSIAKGAKLEECEDEESEDEHS